MSTSVTSQNDEIALLPSTRTSRDERAIQSALSRAAATVALVALTILPNTSTVVVRQGERHPMAIVERDARAYNVGLPNLSDRGWAFAQRVSTHQLAVAPDLGAYPEDLLVEPIDPAIWADLPASRTGIA